MGEAGISACCTGSRVRPTGHNRLPLSFLIRPVTFTALPRREGIAGAAAFTAAERCLKSGLRLRTLNGQICGPRSRSAAAAFRNFESREKEHEGHNEIRTHVDVLRKPSWCCRLDVGVALAAQRTNTCSGSQGITESTAQLATPLGLWDRRPHRRHHVHKELTGPHSGMADFRSSQAGGRVLS